MHMSTRVLDMFCGMSAFRSVAEKIGALSLWDTAITILQTQSRLYIIDCISKKSKKNNGELPMYYVENNHPAIIERTIFDRVQEEIPRRNSKKKVKQVGSKTELGKYSSKYHKLG